MKHKIEIAPNLAIYIDGERVIGSKPHGLFLTTEMIVSDEDLKRLSDRCLEVIVDTPQMEETCERCVYVRWSQWCQGCNGTPKRWDGEKIADTPQTDCG